MGRPAEPLSAGGALRDGGGEPGRRRRLPRAVREAQMLDVARAAFARHGFHGASMDDIATAAGISKPMLYAYFESKEGLFLAAAERAATDLVENVVLAARGGGPPDERLWAGLLAVFEFVDEHREAWRMLYPVPPATAGPFAAGAAAARDRMVRLIAELFREAGVAEGIDEGALVHTDALAHAFVAAVEAAASWWLAHPEEPRELQALRMMNLAWMGLGELVRGRLWLPAASRPPEPAPPGRDPAPQPTRHVSEERTAMTESQAPTPESIDPAMFARLVGQATDEQLAEGFAANRDLILGEVFRRMGDHFRAEDARGVAAVLDWVITDRPDGGSDRFQIVIEDCTCRVERDGERTPDATLSIGPVDFVRLITNHVSGPELFMSGRLKLDGDLMLAARLPGLFRMPA